MENKQETIEKQQAEIAELTEKIESTRIYIEKKRYHRNVLGSESISDSEILEEVYQRLQGVPA